MEFSIIQYKIEGNWLKFKLLKKVQKFKIQVKIQPILVWNQDSKENEVIGNWRKLEMFKRLVQNLKI